MATVTPSCFRLLTHEIDRAFSRALLSAGSSIAAKIAMIAITTNNSIKVKANNFFTKPTSCCSLLFVVHVQHVTMEASANCLQKPRVSSMLHHNPLFFARARACHHPERPRSFTAS
jgi:hypothetical protein